MNAMISTLVGLLWLSIIVFITHGKPLNLREIPIPKDLALKLSRNPQILSQASTDYGHIIHENPFAVLEPTSISDIANLINYSNSLPHSFTISPRGQAHSVLGQAMTQNGIVVNMTQLNWYRNGSGIVVSDCDVKNPLGCYVDVGGEQLWIDVLNATLKHGLTPLSWTDYLYLSVGGTLSNAGIGGQTFRFGPQISNVLELDVITGQGNIVTCSQEKNSEVFYAVLGGLGQFGVITRARILLGPAPTRVKWLRLIYNDFSAFSTDQEHLISFDRRNDSNGADYVEGMLLLNKPPLILSFYPPSDHPRITSLVTQYGITYVLELVKYYDTNSQANITEEVDNLVKGLKFVPTFMFQKDVTYEEFLDRVHSEELILRSKGLWDVPHPWLNMFIPKSRISDFNEGVFKGIILKQNISAGIVLVYPMNRNKWDDRMSAITPDEDVFYTLALLHAAKEMDEVKTFQAQNHQILQFCNDAGIKVKEYLSGNKTHQEWVEHFGAKWQQFEERKAKFDPKRILSPGQGIFQ
ncbi:cytokinin dehydrogenase 2 [Medicago truncatula]|uniref:cytokinin dehydrogenase n=1 Tax=Medicago truncatula TaxID=3880 RepID=G7III7_MEDTR|nr:cytokinin dehydrogenase 2 [Medicago truncatula]AES65430.2 cytokinin oxidase/dehydrogenase-like protein [Medicago truncatula]